MHLIADAAEEISDQTEALWADTDELESRAARIFIESRRVAALCNGLLLIPVPPEAAAVRALATTLLINRWEWAADTATLMRKSGQSSEASLETARMTVVNNLGDFRDEISALAQDYGATEEVNEASQSISSERVTVSFSVPARWLIVQSDSRITMTAPLELQADGLRGLGPGREGFGTSIQVRRVRNVPDWTLADANNQVVPLLNTFGAQIGVEEIEIDGHAGTLHRFSDSATVWATGFAVSVAGDFSFFVETGCPPEFADECRSTLFELLGSMNFDI